MKIVTARQRPKRTFAEHASILCEPGFTKLSFSSTADKNALSLSLYVKERE
jgi:hypothetical protein